jgi:hypothetical protein
MSQATMLLETQGRVFENGEKVLSANPFRFPNEAIFCPIMSSDGGTGVNHRRRTRGDI